MALGRKKLRQYLLEAIPELNGMNANPLPGANLYSFKENCWEKFVPGYAIDMITGSEQFQFQHFIMFQSLCTWIMVPKRQDIVRNVVALAAGTAAARIEKRGISQEPKLWPISDVLIRLEPKIKKFFDEVYLPIGGLHAALQANPKNPTREQVLAASHGIEEVVLMLAVFHYHVDQMSSGAYRSPSVDAASKLLMTLGTSAANIQRSDDKRGERSVMIYWSKMKLAAPLIYAASQVPFGAGSLLDAIRSGTATHRSCGNELPKWFGMARYFAEAVMSKCPFAQEPDYAAIDFGAVPQVPFSPPSFSSTDSDKIKSQFLIES